MALVKLNGLGKYGALGLFDGFHCLCQKYFPFKFSFLEAYLIKFVTCLPWPSKLLTGS